MRYFKYSHARTGTLFEGRFRSSLVQEDEYLLACLRYIELNPVRARMVGDPGDYLWSSYRTHGLGTQALLWTPHATLPDAGLDNPLSNSVGETAGFSLHAGVATKANERAKLEGLCRCITRPAISTKRLSLTQNGQVRYELKTPWRNGTTHVIFELLDFISRLVALVPRPRVNLTRFHGVFA